ncbi:uncharacterized protein LOC136082550 [Hydra vulgaris]|uniref:Uncharacterized protein LOC136082550 n=1 Tax=Hydra vulgaris TaxID=6087 RepID=A0ABM4C8T9_HYDVU
MHIGHDNQKNKYTLKCNIEELETSKKNLKETSLERDLGVYITNDLKWEHHIEYIVNKANTKLGLTKHAFNYINKNTMKLLYISLVRPHLEYAFQIWNPYYAKDIILIERVQKRATKICFPKGINYEQNMKLLKLVDGRLRGDLIQMFRFQNNIDKKKLV